MDLNILESLTDSDKDILVKVFKTIKKEKAATRAYKSRIDNVCLSYQRQVAALVKECEEAKQRTKQSSADQSWLDFKLNEARKETEERCRSQMSKLENNLLNAQTTIKSVKGEKDFMEVALCSVREAAASDATRIHQLQEELLQLRENKERAVSDSVEKHTRNIQLMQDSREADDKVAHYEDDNAFLKFEMTRLNNELAQTRTRMDSMNASHNAATSSANRANSELTNTLAAAKTRIEKLTESISGLERTIIDLKASFENEKHDHQATVGSLSKLIEMHRDAAKDAELRVSEYKELLAVLAKETNDTRDRPPENAPLPLDLHAEVLFKTLNETLETKLQILENERHELIRARANEARMATRQQGLIREAESSRAEAHEARRQMVILETELNAQKDKNIELQRKLALYGTKGGLQSPPMLPVVEAVDPGFTRGTPETATTRKFSGQGRSPFLRGLSMAIAERTADNMKEIQRRHETLLEQVKGRQDA